MAAILLQRCSASQHAGYCQNYALCAQSVYTRGRVAATYPWDMYPQHVHECANLPRYTSLLHVASVCTKQVFSLQHGSATCPCNMTPRVSPPLRWDSSDYYKSRQRVITIYDRYVVTNHDNCYYNLRQALQFTTTFITIHDKYYNSRRYYNSRQHTPTKVWV